MAAISLVSRVRTRGNYRKKHGKNSKNTTRRATTFRSYLENICGAEIQLNNPKRALSKVNLTSMESKHVLDLFLN